MTSATTTTRRTALGMTCAGLFATAVMLAGCSSSSGGHPSGGSGASATTRASTTKAATAIGTGTVAPPETSSATSGSTGGGSVALGGGSFCAVARNEEAAQQKQAGAFNGSPAELKALEEKDAKLLPQFLAIAPDAIKPDVAVIVTADQKLVAALRKANYDITKVDRSALASFDTPALTKASSDIATYLAKTCGIKEPGGAPSP